MWHIWWNGFFRISIKIKPIIFFGFNDYNSKTNESKPKETLRSIPPTSRAQELDFPNHVTTSTSSPVHSSLGSGSVNGQIYIGPGKYVHASFQPAHKCAFFCNTTEYTSTGAGTYSKRRRLRNRCKVCEMKTSYRCTVCQAWICNPSNRPCFNQHKSEKMLEERQDYWQSLQSG